jgi:Ca2+-binding EF-hand superfamily protein
MYGLDHETNKDTPEQKKQEAVLAVFNLFDHNRDGFITMLEWMTGIGEGKQVPDSGCGLGNDFLPDRIQPANLASRTSR